MTVNVYEEHIYATLETQHVLAVESVGVQGIPGIGGVYITTAPLTTTDPEQVIYTFPITLFNSAKYVCQVTHSTSIQLTEILVMHDGTNVYITEYGTMYSGASLGTFTADLSTQIIRLKFSPINTNTTVVISTSNNSTQMSTQRITVSTTEPPSPTINDLWYDLN